MATISPVDLLLAELREQLAPATIEVACALGALNGWATDPYTFARFEEWCEQAGIASGHERWCCSSSCPRSCKTNFGGRSRNASGVSEAPHPP